MARPKKQGIEYFPLDVDFFEDEKIEAISGEFGLKGELIAIKLLCAIYKKGYFLEWDELIKMKLTKRLPGVSPELLEAVVLRLVKWKFFNEGLFRSAQVLTSVGIQKRWKEATRKRSLNMDKESPFWLLEVSSARNEVSSAENQQNQGFSPSETTQSKVEESKVEEISSNDDIEKKNEIDSDNAIPEFVKKEQEAFKKQFQASKVDWNVWQEMALNNSQLEDVICKQMKISGAAFENFVLAFVAEKTAVGHEPKSASDLNQHLINWVRIKVEAQQKAASSNGKGKMQQGMEKVDRAKELARQRLLTNVDN